MANSNKIDYRKLAAEARSRASRTQNLQEWADFERQAKAYEAKARAREQKERESAVMVKPQPKGMRIDGIDV